MRQLFVTVIEKISDTPGLKKHSDLSWWVRRYMVEVDKLLALQKSQVEFWKRTEIYNPVRARRINLRHFHILWLLAQVKEMQDEQTVIELGWK